MPKLLSVCMLCLANAALSFVRNHSPSVRHRLCSAVLMSDVTSAPDVDLVWNITKYDSSEELTIKVSLQRKGPLSRDLGKSLKRSREDDDELPHDMEEEQKGVPDSVLIYERQMRKAQHSKKSGKELDPNDLDVIYVDEHLVLVNKPSGVLCVPGINCKPSILDLVHEKYGNDIEDRAQMIVHRLDQDTSGLVLFGRTPEVTKRLHAQFRNKDVTKEYECLVMGHLDVEGVHVLNENFRIHVNLPLQRDHEHPPFMRVATPQSEEAALAAVHHLQQHGWKKLVAKKPKESQTTITVVEQGRAPSEKGNLPFTRLRLVPMTGRTHQLRVHCSALGYPIIGDPVYSLYGEACPVGGLQDIDTYGIPAFQQHSANPMGLEPTQNRQVIFRCPLDIQKAWTSYHRPNTQPMCLHASFLELKHPVSGEVMRWSKRPSF